MSFNEYCHVWTLIHYQRGRRGRTVPSFRTRHEHGPEGRYCTPSAMWLLTQQWSRVDLLRLRLKLGRVLTTRTLRDRTSRKSLQGCTCGVSW